MSGIGWSCCDDCLELIRSELWHELRVSEAREVPTILEDSRAVDNELLPLKLSNACCEGAFFQSVDAISENQREKDTKRGRLV